jgi:acylphosphatase
MSEKIAIRCFVSGKVQGVWFRASTQEQAKALGLVGWAKNLPDGRVEVLAVGSKDKLTELYQWLHEGPPLAHVTEVTYEELPIPDALERFETH